MRKIYNSRNSFGLLARALNKGIFQSTIVEIRLAY